MSGGLPRGEECRSAQEHEREGCYQGASDAHPLLQQRRGMGGQRPEAVGEQTQEYDAGEGTGEDK